MRDTRNTESVGSALNEFAESIAYTRNMMLDAKDSEVKQDLADLLIQFQIDQCIAAYSGGLGKDQFQYYVLNLIDDLSNHFVMDRVYYDYVCEVVSIAVLADIELDDFKRISKVLAKFKVRDKLLNFLVSSVDSEWSDNSNDFIQKKPYSKLKRVIDESDESSGIREAGNYLRSWYNDNSDAPWHDTHLLEEGNAYVGYWCWEVAALVKAKGWNDDKLKDNEYYPYDAVHW
jgi:hypothetical protein